MESLAILEHETLNRNDFEIELRTESEVMYFS